MEGRVIIENEYEIEIYETGLTCDWSESPHSNDAPSSEMLCSFFMCH